MKRIGVFVLLVVLVFGGVLAAEPEVGVGAEDVEAIEGVIEDLPFDESGDVNVSKYKPFKSRAEERVEVINRYVGPVTRVLWGVELEISWIFIFAFVLWILLIELIIVPVSSIFDWEIWWSLLGSAIISTLAMQGFGKDFVVWVDSLMTQWWIGIIVLGFAVIGGIAYSVFFKFIAAHAKKIRERSKKEMTERDRKILAIEAKLIKDSLKG
jgi:hypothetical protein